MQRPDACWQVQPPFLPDVNWNDPITKGLIGLIWTGPGGPIDLVSPVVLSSDAAWLPKSAGIAAVTPAGTVGAAYTARNVWGRWAPTTPSLTFMTYFKHTKPGGTTTLAGTLQGATGYGLADQFGIGFRLASATVDGVQRSASGGPWKNVPSVKGLRLTPTSLEGFEDGEVFGSTTFAAGTSIPYDATFGRLFLIGSPDTSATAGEAYWMALWDRPMTETEIVRLGREPWCWAKVPGILLPGYYMASGALLGGATVIDLTGSSFRPRVRILSLP